MSREFVAGWYAEFGNPREKPKVVHYIFEPSLAICSRTLLVARPAPELRKCRLCELYFLRRERNVERVRWLRSEGVII